MANQTDSSKVNKQLDYSHRLVPGSMPEWVKQKLAEGYRPVTFLVEYNRPTPPNSTEAIPGTPLPSQSGLHGPSPDAPVTMGTKPWTGPHSGWDSSDIPSDESLVGGQTQLPRLAADTDQTGEGSNAGVMAEITEEMQQITEPTHGMNSVGNKTVSHPDAMDTLQTQTGGVGSGTVRPVTGRTLPSPDHLPAEDREDSENFDLGLVYRTGRLKPPSNDSDQQNAIPESVTTASSHGGDIMAATDYPLNNSAHKGQGHSQTLPYLTVTAGDLSRDPATEDTPSTVPSIRDNWVVHLLPGTGTMQEQPVATTAANTAHISTHNLGTHTTDESRQDISTAASGVPPPTTYPPNQSDKEGELLPVDLENIDSKTILPPTHHTSAVMEIGTSPDITAGIADNQAGSTTQNSSHLQSQDVLELITGGDRHVGTFESDIMPEDVTIAMSGQSGSADSSTVRPGDVHSGLIGLERNPSSSAQETPVVDLGYTTDRQTRAEATTEINGNTNPRQDLQGSASQVTTEANADRETAKDHTSQEKDISSQSENDTSHSAVAVTTESLPDGEQTVKVDKELTKSTSIPTTSTKSTKGIPVVAMTTPVPPHTTRNTVPATSSLSNKPLVEKTTRLSLVTQSTTTAKNVSRSQSVVATFSPTRSSRRRPKNRDRLNRRHPATRKKNTIQNPPAFTYRTPGQSPPSHALFNANPQMNFTATTPAQTFSTNGTLLPGSGRFPIGEVSTRMPIGEVTGIAVACIVIFWIILGPVVCLICRMRDKAERKRRERQHEDSMSHILIEEMIRTELARGRAKRYRTNIHDERELERLPVMGEQCCLNTTHCRHEASPGYHYRELSGLPASNEFEKDMFVNKTFVDSTDRKSVRFMQAMRDTNV